MQLLISQAQACDCNVPYCMTTDKAGKSFLSMTPHDGVSLSDRSAQRTQFSTALFTDYHCNMLIYGINDSLVPTEMSIMG